MQFDKEVWESRVCEALLRYDSLSNLNKGELPCIKSNTKTSIKAYLVAIPQKTIGMP